MSLFDDIAHAIGHTVDTLAQDVGAGVYELESLVAGLANDGVEVFSAAEHFGLSMVDFLRRMVTILRGDPHQVLLHYVTGPIKPVNEQVDTLSMHWTQMAALHQDTAQTINAHLSDLYQANGSFSYSGQAAEALWNTHQQYQQHFTTLVEHAQTQQTRHATLGSHTSDFLSQAPGKVYSLSAPMAALGVMSFEMTAVAPPPVFDDPAVQGVEQGIEETVQTGEEGPPGILWIIIAIIVVVLVLVLVIVVLYVLIRDAIESFQNQQKSTTVQQPKHKPMVAPPVQGSQNSAPVNLTDAQRRLFNDVKSRLGSHTYDDKEIEALILAGYLDPDAIAAIIRGGNYTVFNNADVAKLTNELTDAQQLKFIAIVEQYQKTHPGLTSHQVYNYLWYIKMKAQLANLADNITGSDPTDPVSLAIVGLFPSRAIDLKQRLDDKVGINFGTVTDPFTVTDARLNGWYANLTGVWGEWATIKQYYQQGKLVDYSIPITDGEVDIKIKENGVLKWVEVKNVQSVKNAWRKALDQVTRYITVDHATSVIIELPQQGIHGNPGPSSQQLQNLQDLERRYPSVKFEVRMGSSDPRLQIPFDPSSNNWGSYLP